MGEFTAQHTGRGGRGQGALQQGAARAGRGGQGVDRLQQTPGRRPNTHPVVLFLSTGGLQQGIHRTPQTRLRDLRRPLQPGAGQEAARVPQQAQRPPALLSLCRQGLGQDLVDLLQSVPAHDRYPLVAHRCTVEPRARGPGRNPTARGPGDGLDFAREVRVR
ncbi:hypothetical protein GCM10018783_00560 [Streptomyces griseosporeus]|nr:hypothetical protein GCM10018783_00560 [Streptomyces griseosporeus]